jgi:hypothetical protein
MEERMTSADTGCVLITDLDFSIIPGISAAKTKKTPKTQKSISTTPRLARAQGAPLPVEVLL